MAVDSREIGEVRFGGAITVATIFRVLALMTVIGGAIAGAAGAANISSSSDQSNGTALTAYIAGVAVVTVVTAALLAFLDYVLEILVGMYTQVWHVRFGELEDEEEGDEEELTE